MNLRRGQSQLLSGATYLLTTLVGLLAFLYPFWMPALAQGATGQDAHASDSAFVLTLLVLICFAVLLLEVQTEGMSAKTVALLGVLVAINATLRFLDVVLPGPGGFSPIFPLIVLTGYVFGGRFGFLMGALTLLVSAILVGSVGPWLPYQMFTAGWIGLTAPLCRPLVRVFGGPGTRREVAILASFGAAWGMFYGLVMNIWFWPFVTGPATMYWEPGITAAAVVQRYAVFYLVTSLAWDLAAAIGNLLLIAVVGKAVLRVLRRFQGRFAFSYRPLVGERVGG